MFISKQTKPEASGSPIAMGIKGTRIDWSAFEERAMRDLGRLPARSVPMSSEDLLAMGFAVAADAPLVRALGDF